MAARPSDWRELAQAEAALLDGGPGARSAAASRRFLQLVRPARRSPLARSRPAARCARAPAPRRPAASRARAPLRWLRGVRTANAGR
jgi:hypothetical protein